MIVNQLIFTENNKGGCTFASIIHQLNHKIISDLHFHYQYRREETNQNGQRREKRKKEIYEKSIARDMSWLRPKVITILNRGRKQRVASTCQIYPHREQPG